MNNYTAIGRLTRDTETRAAGGGNVTSISIAVNTPWKDKSGEWKESTLFLRVTAWGKLSDKASALKKGDSILVAGNLESKAWVTSNGEKKESIELKALTIESINVVTRSGATNDNWKTKGKSKSDTYSSDLNDDIPF